MSELDLGLTRTEVETIRAEVEIDVLLNAFEGKVVGPLLPHQPSPIRIHALVKIQVLLLHIALVGFGGWHGRGGGSVEGAGDLLLDLSAPLSRARPIRRP